MKFLFSTSVLIFVLSLTLTCSAICDCEPADQECVQQCVTEANSCITSSKGETSYEDCIDDKWPSGDMFHKQDVPARPSNTDGKNEPSGSGSNTIASGTSSPGKATHSSGSSSPTGSGNPYKASETNVNANNNNNNKNMSASNSGATTLPLNEMGLMMVALVCTWVLS